MEEDRNVDPEFGIQRPGPLHDMVVLLALLGPRHPQHGLHALDEREERGQAAVSLAAALHVTDAVVGQRGSELVKEPALSHTGVPDHRDDTAQPRVGVLEGPKQRVEFLRPPDETGQGAGRGRLEAAWHFGLAKYGQGRDGWPLRRHGDRRPFLHLHEWNQRAGQVGGH